jgi:GR25 family glycosyltransferase involved in LPS biosynthesis
VRKVKSQFCTFRIDVEKAEIHIYRNIRRLVLPGYSSGTPGYALSLQGAHKLLSLSYEKEIIPLDEYMPALYTYHPRRDLRQRFQSQVISNQQEQQKRIAAAKKSNGNAARTGYMLQAFATQGDIVRPVDHDDSDTKRSAYHGSRVHPALAAWLQGGKS